MRILHLPVGDKVTFLPRSAWQRASERLNGVGGRHLGTRVGHVALRQEEKARKRTNIQCRGGEIQGAVTVDWSCSVPSSSKFMFVKNPVGCRCIEFDLDNSRAILSYSWKKIKINPTRCDVSPCTYAWFGSEPGSRHHKLSSRPKKSQVGRQKDDLDHAK